MFTYIYSDFIFRGVRAWRKTIFHLYRMSPAPGHCSQGDIMSSKERYLEIADKAEDLAKCIKQHDITVRYNDLAKKIRADEQAQAVYERLVRLGKDIADAKENGKELDESFINENEVLKSDLQKNPIVREFVDSQKDYFEMMSFVQRAISSIS